jgi:2-iminobutanoate/2-iminopropanoate deaminase
MKATNTPGYTAGDWLIVSGQTGRIGEKLVGEDFDAQFTQCMVNVEAVLKARGLSRNSVAKVNIYLRRMGDRERMNGLYSDFFGEHLPARTTVGVAELSRGALVEIEAWAYTGQPAPKAS